MSTEKVEAIVLAHSAATYDVVIVGGSYAGLSAGMALGRAVRNVLIIDNGRPCNRQTPYAHNLITQDGATPAYITAVAKEQVLAYPTVLFRTDTVTAVIKTTNAFELRTAADETIRAKKILFATGVNDLLPAIDGFRTCWGVSVIHCPYCHGYEYRDQPTGILVNGATALDFGKLVRNWTKELTIFTNGEPTFSPAHQESLRALNIAVVAKPIRSIVHTNGLIESLRFTDGTYHPLRVLYARVPFEQHCSLPQALGCLLMEGGLLQVDEFKRTSLPGLYAAGDNSGLLRSVAGAIASGTAAGAFINHDLITEGA